MTLQKKIKIQILSWALLQVSNLNLFLLIHRYSRRYLPKRIQLRKFENQTPKFVSFISNYFQNCACRFAQKFEFGFQKSHRINKKSFFKIRWKIEIIFGRNWIKVGINVKKYWEINSKLKLWLRIPKLYKINLITAIVKNFPKITRNQPIYKIRNPEINSRKFKDFANKTSLQYL